METCIGGNELETYIVIKQGQHKHTLLLSARTDLQRKGGTLSRRLLQSAPPSMLTYVCRRKRYLGGGENLLYRTRFVVYVCSGLKAKGLPAFWILLSEGGKGVDKKRRRRKIDRHKRGGRETERDIRRGL